MSDFVYFLSSLPLLKFGETKLDGVGGFAGYVQRCQQRLDESDAAVIAGLAMTPPAEWENLSDATARAWYGFETELRNAGVRVLAKNRRNADGAQWQRPVSMEYGWLEKSMEKLLSGKSGAYEQEIELQKLRWNFLDDLASCHQFDLALAVIYGIRLLILEQMAKYGYEMGRSQFEIGLDKVLSTAVRAE